MVFLLILILLVQGQAQNQIDPNTPPDVEVGKFSWTRHRGADPTSPIMTANPLSRKFLYRREIENRNSIENRSRDLRELEESVWRDQANEKKVDIYQYKVNVKNSGAKVIKWIFLDYQTTHPSDPDNPSHREFACAVRIKPTDNRLLVGESLLPPSRVVTASGEKAILTEKLIINRIEYADGAVWQRSDWIAPDNVSAKPAGRGPCRPI